MLSLSVDYSCLARVCFSLSHKYENLIYSPQTLHHHNKTTKGTTKHTSIITCTIERGFVSWRKTGTNRKRTNRPNDGKPTESLWGKHKLGAFPQVKIYAQNRQNLFVHTLF